MTCSEPADWPGGTSDPYTRALVEEGEELFIQPLHAVPIPLDVMRWCAPADDVDNSILERCLAPVLDVGCGPGRLTVAATRRGLPALGVDVTQGAVDRAVRDGALALRRSVFDQLPAEGRWGTVLLIDGNIGIGGDPTALLHRCAQLLCPPGLLLVEVESGQVDERYLAQLVDGRGRRSAPFRWAQLGAQALIRYAERAGVVVTEEWHRAGRTFCALSR